MNFISSLTSFAGAILGVSLGTTWNAAPWIFSITAGLFIYIALVDMVGLRDIRNKRICLFTINAPYFKRSLMEGKTIYLAQRYRPTIQEINGQTAKFTGK